MPKPKSLNLRVVESSPTRVVIADPAGNRLSFAPIHSTYGEHEITSAATTHFERIVGKRRPKKEAEEAARSLALTEFRSHTA